MEDTAKYLIHADITADGVVERSDVVGAIFGQTEGLLGDELDIRGLQRASKLGRIDVDVESEGGQSFGHVTIASNLDRVETAILAAALESIDRVGPCRAYLQVTDIRDARAAKRREIVDRAKELLSTTFDEGALSSTELIEEVRESMRVEDVVEYAGLPAGPRVADGDAVIVVEGRADVLTLLRYGIKNGVAVEGTDVPEAIAELTHERTTTAFLDGDRGGDLILRELVQVGDVDYVARAPEGRSVEDLDREAVTAALREKVPVDVALRTATDEEGETATDDAAATGSTRSGAEADTNGGVRAASTADAGPEAAAVAGDAGDDEPTSMPAHADEVVGGSGSVRLLDDDLEVLAEAPVDEAIETIDAAEPAPYAVVLDGPITQALLDVAADRGVERVAGAEHGQYTKRPADVRAHTTEELSRSSYR